MNDGRKNNPGPRRLPGILPALLAEPFAASCKQNQGQVPALCFAYAVTVTTWVATNSPSTVFTVTVAVPPLHLTALTRLPYYQ